MSKKFWRSGMIDKKVVKEREEAEYINKLERVILELTREEEEPKYATIYTSDNRSFKREIPREKLLTPTQSAKKCGEDIAKLFINDYDEIKHGDNVTLEFTDGCILAAPRERLKDSMFNAYSRWLRNRGSYDSDLKFEKQTFGEVEDENNTRDI